MIHHQHYFPVVSKQGRLMPHFLAVTNTPRDNVAGIARNAERVLVARLRDARFFWDADRRTRLETRLDRLDTLLFHKKLGSYRAKTDRVAELAERIAREVLGVSEAATHARLAGTLAKADLTTEMVGEFPELQGNMGGVYAREQGEPEEVWKAVYHHYLPVGVEADAPPSRRDLGVAAVTWAALSLADKLDTLVGLFHAGEKPTGSRDPLGMRRQAQGLIRTLMDLPDLTGVEMRVSLGQLLELAYDVHGRPPDDEIALRETTFVLERTRYVLEERGFDVRNVRSVTHQASLDDLRPLDARRKLEVLPQFTGTGDFRQLATVFKRVRNIAKELGDDEFLTAENTGSSLAGSLHEPSEKALLEEFERRRPVIEASVESGDKYRQAFAEASKFGPAVAKFFDDVMVMTEDEGLRTARLRLMKRIERLILQLADVSEIVREDM
jgi:glycyl-tRNA synthetase beta chain